jgi:hypothetical protein
MFKAIAEILSNLSKFFTWLILSIIIAPIPIHIIIQFISGQEIKVSWQNLVYVYVLYTLIFVIVVAIIWASIKTTNIF